MMIIRRTKILISQLTGNIYEGEVQNGLRHGKGTEYKKDKFYKGEWDNNKKHGFGVEVSTNGSVYKGTWNKDKK
jgi:hypothetical protein